MDKEGMEELMNLKLLLDQDVMTADEYKEAVTLAKDAAKARSTKRIAELHAAAARAEAETALCKEGGATHVQQQQAAMFAPAVQMQQAVQQQAAMPEVQVLPNPAFPAPAVAPSQPQPGPSLAPPLIVVQPTAMLPPLPSQPVQSKQQQKRAKKAEHLKNQTQKGPSGVLVAHATPAEAPNPNPDRAKQLKDDEMEVVATFDTAKEAYRAVAKCPPQGFRFCRSTQYQQRMTDEEKAVAPINPKTGRHVNNKPWIYVYYCCEHLVGTACPPTPHPTPWPTQTPLITLCNGLWGGKLPMLVATRQSCDKNMVLWPRPCKGRSCCAPCLRKGVVLQTQCHVCWCSCAVLNKDISSDSCLTALRFHTWHVVAGDGQAPHNIVVCHVTNNDAVTWLLLSMDVH